MDDGIDDQILLAVEGKIQLVTASDIQSSSDVLDNQKMATKEITTSVSAAPNNHNNNNNSYSTVIAVKPQPSCNNYQGHNTSKYLFLPRKGDYDKERERNNEQAFQSWLRKKIELHKSSHVLHSGTNVDRIDEDKRYLNEKAFTAWLEKKKEQKDTIKPANTVEIEPQISIMKHSYSHEEWKRKKDKEKSKQEQFDNYRRQELEETTKHLDTDLAKKAYKRFINNCNIINVT